MRARTLGFLSFALGPLALYWTRSLIVVLGVLALVTVWGRTAPAWSAVRSVLREPAGVALVALAVWCLYSVSWARLPGEALYDFSRITLICVFGLAFMGGLIALEPGEREAMRRGLWAGLWVALVLIGIEALTGGAIGRLVKAHAHADLGFLDGGGVVLALFAWPAASMLARRGRVAAATAILALLLVAVFVLPMRATMVGMVVAVIVWLLVYRYRARALRILAAIFAVLALAAPVAFSTFFNLHGLDPAAERLPYSWQHRLLIWEYTTDRGLRHPLIGFGVESSSRISKDRDTRSAYVAMAVARGRPELGMEPPLHPHNAVVQLWYELGGIGVVLALGVLLGVARSLAAPSRHRVPAACAAASLTVWLTVACLSYGVWQKWWLACGWIAVGVCVLARLDDGAEPEQEATAAPAAAA